MKVMVFAMAVVLVMMIVFQCEFFDFYIGKHHQIIACAWVEALQITLQIGIVRMEAAKVEL